MTNSLYNRIYQRVYAVVTNDEQFCAYLAEICTDSNSHCDDLRDTIDTIFKASHPNISETRRQHVIYSLLDMIEEDRQKTNQEIPYDSDDADDNIYLSEKLERNGECKLCGCKQRITSRKKKQENKFYHSKSVFVHYSPSPYSKTNSETNEKLRQRIGRCIEVSY